MKQRTQADHQRELLQVLIGGTIIGTTGTIDDPESEITGFVVKCKDGKQRLAFILQDPEGNGPGWLDFEIVEG